MEEHLKDVWTASAAVEGLQVEMDQAETTLDAAIDAALKAGAAPEEILVTANLSPSELSERVPALALPDQAAEESDASAL
ncbi:hypothetical protein E4J89_15430 [Arthrobacter sp. CAU 1506]|uniref:hypothetical protein n=1 Tax=Arthrobacter sp. CAU 1506 TaxID=2560052 RepID=UPI0010ABE885|nr:hypothetical protein [Arthrobacter sp. CAU 1506]TJY67281.1 hypothetical protein E4J89_15430 [Arthrobacter sp. CAU 1506]